jgi:hypothetical protein
MSQISDFKGAPFSLFGSPAPTSQNASPTPPAGGASTDVSIATLCGISWDTTDGRKVAMVQVGATALVSGNMVQSPANLANFVSLVTVGTQAIGSTTIVVTLGGTAVLANEFAGGYAIVSAATGIGQTFRISNHLAQATTTGNVTLNLEDPISVALDATSTVTMVLPQYGSINGTVASNSVASLGVIVCPTTLTGRVLGATIYPIAASTSTVPTYGFIQTRGECGVLSQGGTAIGRDVMSPGSVAGAVATYAVASGTRVGVTTIALTDAAVGSVNLQL